MRQNRLWRPPRLFQDVSEEEARKVTWLELFYDLIYVATLVQLGDSLSHDVSWSGFLRFAFLFVPIWWAWSGITFYMNRFVVDDFRHRVLIFIQIVFIALTALSVQGAFGDLAMQFALAYAGIRLILIVLYFRAGQAVPAARELSRRYVTFFIAGMILWVISAFTPPPYNYALWFLALLVDFSLSFSPRTRELQQRSYRPDPHHLIERYGLFTIIVLGESFIKTLTAAAGTTITPYSVIFAFFSIGISFALWWL
jgi:low temperature requirement protein LtrA